MASGGEDQGTGGKAPLIRFKAVSKSFGAVAAVETFTLEIAQGEFFALLGPSGCGKTTLLRMLAGFETPSEGRIFLGGEDIVAGAAASAARKHDVPKLRVVSAPHGRRQRRLRIAPGECGAARKSPCALPRCWTSPGFRASAGAKFTSCRVASVSAWRLPARLIKRPRVLLLDEPLAALDKKLRAETQFELMELQRKLGTTFVIVTHDQEEAMIVADRIAVMNQGRLMQVATPTEIYEQPKSRWVADFIGEVTIIEGRSPCPAWSTARWGRSRVADRAMAGPAKRCGWRCARKKSA